MTELADRAVLLLQRVRELLLESRAVAQQLETVPLEIDRVPEAPSRR